MSGQIEVRSRLAVRAWNGTPIARRPVDGYVNATAMCKANGRLWADYWRSERASQYLKALSTDMGNPITGQGGLVISIRGGEAQGTWVHERVAVDLARWLSPEFAVWMDGWFVEEAKRQLEVSEAERKKIDARIKGKVTRIALCDELFAHDVDGDGIRDITNVQYRIMFSTDAAGLRKQFGLKCGDKRNPRDMMQAEDLTRVHLHEFALKEQTNLHGKRGNSEHILMASNTSHALEKLLTQPILADSDSGTEQLAPRPNPATNCSPYTVFTAGDF